MYYKDSNNEWKPVENISTYGVEKGIGNEVKFKPVATKSIKLEVKLAEKNAAGIFEWIVE
jgi:hypothetical protein